MIWILESYNEQSIKVLQLAGEYAILIKQLKPSCIIISIDQT